MSQLQVYSTCPCGSGKQFKFCCHKSYKETGFIEPSPACHMLPVVGCKILKKWQEHGMSHVFVSRKYAEGLYILVGYLVDFWCLGVKDVLMKIEVTPREWEHFEGLLKENKNGPLVDVSYQDARSLILGAIDYAQSIGLPGYPNWAKLTSLFIEGNLPYEKKFTFGKDGVPFYMMGPHDREEYDINEIVSKVNQASGEYILEMVSWS